MPPKSKAAKAAETTKKPRASSENPKETKAAKVEETVFLDFSGSPMISDSDFKKAIDSAAGIVTSIDLSYCKQITCEGLEYLVMNREQHVRPSLITAINFHNCYQIGDSHLQHIVQLKSLTFLDLFNCNFVTDAGVQQISANLTSLTSLNLGGVEKITDEGIHHIAEKLSSLTSLALQGCFQITDLGLQHLSKMSSLRSLTLAMCSKISDDGIQFLADRLTSLTVLDLTYCSKITDASLRQIAAKLTGLTSLTIYECTKITKAAKKQFQIALPQCKLAG